MGMTIRRASRARVFAFLSFGRDDGLQILALPPLFASVAIRRSVRGLLDLIDGGLFDVRSIHLGASGQVRA